jgi:FMN-dependent NADH-azoreductase
VIQLEKTHPRIAVTHRDLTSPQIPHLDSEQLTALNTPEEQRSVAQQDRIGLSDQLINELFQAETLIIGAPMYNFAVPSVLKSWFDHVARAGVTFRYGENGPQGLLKIEQTYVITSRGGIHKGQASDSETAFLRTMLGFLGIDTIEFIYAEGLNMGDGQREAGLNAARQQIQQL